MGKHLVIAFVLLSAATASESQTHVTFVQNTSGLRKEREILAVLRGNIAGKEEPYVHAPTNLAENETDMFTSIIHPGRLQPLYFIPFANGLKVIITFAVLGFDIPFAQKDTKFQWTIKAVALHMMKTLPLIFLVLNSWAHDLKAGWNVPGQTFMVRTYARVVLCSISSNYGAALSVWGALAIQSPPRALKLTPKYTNLYGIPLSPVGAVWLQPLKWLYCVCLLPYLLMDKVIALWLNALICFIFCIRSCFQCQLGNLCKGFCCCFSTCTKACVFFCFSLIPTILTVGLWSYARQSTCYWFMWLWEGSWPFLLLLLVNILSVHGLPACFTLIYSKCKGISQENTTKAMFSEASAVDQYSLPSALQLEDDDRFTLIEYNRINLEEDFELDEEAGGKSDLDDAKVAIINSTLKFVGTILVKQLICIYTVRAIFYIDNTHNLGDYFYIPGQNSLLMQALKRTVSERSWSLYISTLEGKGIRGLGKASQVLNTLWNLL